MQDAIIRKLRTDYKCHALILYGSRARGDFSQESDWDCFGLGEAALAHDSFQMDGQWVDVSIAVAPEASEVTRLKDGIVLYDERGEGAALLGRVKELLAHAPPRSEVQLNHNRNWTMKMLGRIRRDDVEARYRRHWLLFQLLEDYFAYRGLWYFGSKEALRYLEKNDRATYRLYEAALAPGATLQELEVLARHVILPG